MTDTISLKARVALLEALEIDPHRVINDGLRIHIPVHDVPTVTVTLLLNDRHMGKLATVLKGFELVERWDTPGEDVT